MEASAEPIFEAGNERIVNPVGGLISRVERVLTAPGGGPPFAYCGVLNDVGQVLPNVREIQSASTDISPLAGVGMAWDEESARTYCVAEAIERYSSCVIPEERIRWATATELGDQALSVNTIPVCSERERSHPACPLLLPDPSARIRWVLGFSLLTLKPVWLPAIMVYIRIPPIGSGERFWLPVSTGCAAHPLLEQAIVNGICEIIERDAIALLWILRFSLPKILHENSFPELPRRRGQILLFDATTDLGVPTLFAVDRADDASELATLVCSSADLNPHRALKKALAEAVLYRLAMESPGVIPSDPDRFTQPIHGAIYMSHPTRRKAFDFLLESPKVRCLAELRCLDSGVPAQNLRLLLDRLSANGMDVFVVDITSDEARAAGLHVVRVIVPALQPLTFRLRARYLAHPRLFEAPVRMGYPLRREEEMNPWPQPFG